MAGEIEAYQDVLKGFSEHEKSVSSVIENTRRAIADLGAGGWKSVSLNGVPLPAEIVLSKNNKTFDAERWPTGEQLKESIARWHELRGKLRNAWDRIPDSRRVGITPPS
jgi:hypothetical protein